MRAEIRNRYSKCSSVCLIFFLLLATSCQQPIEQKKIPFKHVIESEQKPWTHLNFNDSDDQFAFAIIGDLTGGERAYVFEIAVEQLNLLNPAFVICVGDLIEGNQKSEKELDEQWESFNKRANGLNMPFFYVGGNHDLNDQEQKEEWKERYGPSYYHFYYKNNLFLILDTEDNSPERQLEINRLREDAIEVYKAEGLEAFNATPYGKLPEQYAGNIGEVQRDYFIKVLESADSLDHIYIFLHKAPWEAEDPEFLEIENSLKGHEYTVFHGHEHAYDLLIRNGMDYIRMATTGGVQLPEKGPSIDHLVWVTSDTDGPNYVNLLMEGIRNKEFEIPLSIDSIEFSKLKHL